MATDLNTMNIPPHPTTRLQADWLPTSLPQQEPTDFSYYRPQTFVPTTGANPLITASAPLLALAARLKGSLTYQEPMQLYHAIIHEIRVFEQQAQQQGYRTEIILLVRYVLCVTLDELIAQAPWSKNEYWTFPKLLTTLQPEQTDEERFFLILERLLPEAHLHIELLELMYLCLSLGFQGNHRNNSAGEIQLITIKEQLYRHIRSYRGDLPENLCQPMLKPPLSPPTQATHPWQRPLGLLIFTGILLGCLYAGINTLLNINLTPFYQDLLMLTQNLA